MSTFLKKLSINRESDILCNLWNDNYIYFSDWEGNFIVDKIHLREEDRKIYHEEKINTNYEEPFSSMYNINKNLLVAGGAYGSFFKLDKNKQFRKEFLSVGGKRNPKWGYQKIGYFKDKDLVIGCTFDDHLKFWDIRAEKKVGKISMGFFHALDCDILNGQIAFGTKDFPFVMELETLVNVKDSADKSSKLIKETYGFHEKKFKKKNISFNGPCNTIKFDKKSEILSVTNLSGNAYFYNIDEDNFCLKEIFSYENDDDDDIINKNHLDYFSSAQTYEIKGKKYFVVSGNQISFLSKDKTENKTFRDININNNFFKNFEFNENNSLFYCQSGTDFINNQIETKKYEKRVYYLDIDYLKNKNKK